MTHVETARPPSLDFFPCCQSQTDHFQSSSAWFSLDLERTHVHTHPEIRGIYHHSLRETSARGVVVMQDESKLEEEKKVINRER